MDLISPDLAKHARTYSWKQRRATGSIAKVLLHCTHYCTQKILVAKIVILCAPREINIGLRAALLTGLFFYSDAKWLHFPPNYEGAHYYTTKNRP